MDEHEKLERARQQVNVLLGFYIHLAVFVATMALLLVINFAVYYWANSVWWVERHDHRNSAITARDLARFPLSLVR